MEIPISWWGALSSIILSVIIICFGAITNNLFIVIYFGVLAIIFSLALLFATLKKCGLSINGRCKGNFSPLECNGLDHPEECNEILNVKSEQAEVKK